MNHRLCVVALYGVLLSATGCDGGEEETPVDPLLVREGVFSAFVVQDGLSASAELPEAVQAASPVELYSDSGHLVAQVNADPRVVPIQWGESTADASSEFMRVTAQVEEAFVDQITQIELRIDVGGDGTEDFCEPMKRDSVVSGGFFLQLQPGCVTRDPLTEECTIEASITCTGADGQNVGGCREDRLTFSLWDDITTVCHGWGDEE